MHSGGPFRRSRVMALDRGDNVTEAVAVAALAERYLAHVGHVDEPVEDQSLGVRVLRQVWVRALPRRGHVETRVQLIVGTYVAIDRGTVGGVSQMAQLSYRLRDARARGSVLRGGGAHDQTEDRLVRVAKTGSRHVDVARGTVARRPGSSRGGS